MSALPAVTDLEAPPAFHLLAKPTGAVCNLDCSYWYEWEEPHPKEPKGVPIHTNSVLLGRKLSGKSHRELADLGLTVDDGVESASAAAGGAS